MAALEVVSSTDVSSQPIPLHHTRSMTSPVGRPERRLRQRATKGSKLSGVVHGLHPSSPGTPRRYRGSPKPIKILHKCSSESFIFPATDAQEDPAEGCRSPMNGEGGLFYRMHSLNDFLLSPIKSPTTMSNNGYEKEAKVVITVTMEGSPGPFRLLVKLGSSVDDIIKLVVKKYGDEGRLPQLHSFATPSFDLHLSYFSFHCLDRSMTIGEVGKRSFYLRKRSLSIIEEGSSSRGGTHPSPPVVLLIPPLLPRKVVFKLGRRMRKLFVVFGCLQQSS